ncbi:Thioredoxin reductase [Flavobacterium glycines]|uniref:Pyridine nucleotide-disulfide oxidoreductase n=2 Tax=Flavobacterium glycines TaxID=551990 RepID=A0A1B9DH12_9FLAO|nr:NAD(P)/FAD-dependent oxidoreductase [Flavobacterium glycines]OCB68929.1 pyridine nucleotide-disulfide oxidoreductase [Flavobacterium glycines]GEL11122.1 thioredoxin reductase [Flavobacterium glycines]SDJ27866.1 Thioredoxin reductase [Flavobacterium glycines]
MTETKKISRRELIKQGGLILSALALPFPLTTFLKFNEMTDNKNFDVIIVGGSYAGLSAAMSLGRALRNVLVIDSGLPCNRQTPHSHNFITQDGEKPGVIAEKAKKQVLQYDTVKFLTDLAVNGKKTDKGFEISTQSGQLFSAKKLVFATGLKDIMLNIDGFSECWGISVLHCPYCHGYEVKNQKTGIFANGYGAFHLARLIRNWTKDLTIFTNGKSELTAEQTDEIKRHNISIVEKEITSLKHKDGVVEEIIFADNSTFELKAIYSRPPFEQHCKIPELLGCELTEQGLVKIDALQKTTVDNIFACGDNTNPLRSVPYAVSAGSIAGVAINNAMTEEEFLEK